MDNLTHSLTGALLGQAGLKRKTGLAMPALIIGANIPDIDASCTIYGLQSLAMRRGITHGPIAMVLLPLLLAGALYWYDRWQTKRGKRPEGRLPLRFGWLYALSLLGCLTHPALDWMNVYGVRLLEPFSSEWFYGDTLFIVDVWLWALMIVATWWSLRRERRGQNGRKVAIAAIAVALFYIGTNWTITRDAERLALNGDVYSETIASPVPARFWERELVYPQAQGRVAIVPGYTGPSSDRLNVDQPWDVPLDWCDLDAARRTDPDLDAFLFWSRAPFVQLREDGSAVLRDARFYDPLARDRFSVDLDQGVCDASGSARRSAVARAGR
ncbi:metal-dependent hydrolase [Altererythrobacter sp. CAU 1778]